MGYLGSLYRPVSDSFRTLFRAVSEPFRGKSSESGGEDCDKVLLMDERGNIRVNYRNEQVRRNIYRVLKHSSRVRLKSEE